MHSGKRQQNADRVDDQRRDHDDLDDRLDRAINWNELKQVEDGADNHERDEE